nr:MAG TPA: hypothetical protein [Caudoviricetes sp.]
MFDKDAHHNRKVDEPNFFICILHCSTWYDTTCHVAITTQQNHSL